MGSCKDIARLTDAEKAMVAGLSNQLMARCACICDLETGAVTAMCDEHKYLISVARDNERERIIKIVDEMCGSHNLTKRLRERVAQL